MGGLPLLGGIATLLALIGCPDIKALDAGYLVR